LRNPFFDPPGRSSSMTHFMEFSENEEEAYFRQWRKKQKTAVLVVDVPREAVKTVLDVLATVKGKVRK
ncbi:MAG TPA: hypothetical protein PK959_15800, partial [Candidatus Competibacteraceae bacterium]|nr:hypothetical protein [Candidatus Competibacteraceae bacterium]